MNLRRALLTVGCIAVLVAIVLCLVPVTIEPSSVLPGALRNLLPPAFKLAETSCGSVARPHRPSGFSGVLSAISTLLNTECTHSVRARMWTAVWIAVGGLAIVLVAVFGFDRRRKLGSAAGTPFAPPQAPAPGSAL
jgi:hypothetical protein